MDGNSKDNVGPASESYCALEKGHNGECFYVCDSDKQITPEKPF